MRNITTTLFIFILSLSLISITKASTEVKIDNQVESNQKIINKVFKAYGGDALTSLPHFQLTDHYKSFRDGQSYSAEEVDLQHSTAQLTVDFVNRRKDFKWLWGDKDYFSVRQQLFDGERGYRINHADKTMSTASNLNFRSAERQYSYHLDTALALLLADPATVVTHLDDRNLYGKLHYQVQIEAKGHPKLTLLIDQGTGRIAKLERAHWMPGKVYSYRFSDYQQSGKVLYANSVFVTRGGEPYTVITSREFDTDFDVTSVFELPKGYGKSGVGLDFSTMQAKELSKGLYLVGEDWGFSLFFDAGEYFIGAGGYADLTKRLQFVQKKYNIDKPLKYLVVSHHHLDHLGGMKEAFELGATFVTKHQHVSTIESVVGEQLPQDRLLFVDQQLSFANNQVQAINYPNSHSEYSLVTYFTQGKTLFTADTYLSREDTGSPKGNQGLLKLHQRLQSFNLEPQFYAAAHSFRVLTDKDFAYSLANINESKSVCPANWTICP